MGSYKLPRKRLARKVPRITLATGPRSPSDASNDDDQPEEESEHDESIMDGDEDENGSADDAEEEPMDEDGEFGLDQCSHFNIWVIPCHPYYHLASRG